jgi:integrase
MPPELLDVAAACPTTRVWKTREPEPDLAGLRDRALLLVGFFAALRRSELAVLTVDQITDHDRGLVTGIARSKTNQTGLERELVVLPRTARPPARRKVVSGTVTGCRAAPEPRRRARRPARPRRPPWPCGRAG